MNRYVLHNATSQAHIEDLRDRLSRPLADAFPRPHDTSRADAVAATLAEVVRAMDKGMISARDVESVFAQFRIPGFRFEKWLAEMVDEGVYLNEALAKAA
jgi:hypothetical protein